MATKKITVSKKKLIEYYTRCITLGQTDIWYGVYKLGMSENGLCLLLFDDTYIRSYTYDIFEIPDIFDDISKDALNQIINHYKELKQYYVFSMNGLKRLETNAFRCDEYLKRVSLLKCKYVCDYAFYCCRSLDSALIPLINTVGKYGFAYCQKLTTLIGSPHHIYNYAFYGCQDLFLFDFKNTLDIGAYAFVDCHSLKSCEANKCLKIGIGCFESSGIEYFEGNRLRVLKEETFLSSALRQFRGDSLVTIERNAFDTSNLELFESASVKNVSEHAFANLDNITSISLSNVRRVPLTIIYNCKSLKSIRLDKCVYINNYLFEKCKNLESVCLPSMKQKHTGI